MKWKAPSEEELARRGIKPATDETTEELARRKPAKPAKKPSSKKPSTKKG